MTIRAMHIRYLEDWQFLGKVIFYILLQAVLLYMHLVLTESVFDDAYIHFRIADNFVNDYKPYFNIQDPIMTGSSPGWTILLSIFLLLSKISGIKAELPIIVSIWNSFITLLCAYVYLRIIEVITQKTLPVWLFVFVLLLNTSILFHTSLGLMETPTALLLLGFSLLLLIQKSRYAYILMGLALSFRLELLLAFILAIFFETISKNRSNFKFINCVGIGLLPLIIFDLYFFRTLLPQAIFAKSAVYSLSPALSLGTVVCYFIQCGNLWYIGNGLIIPVQIQILIGIISLLTLIILCIVLVIKTNNRLDLNNISPRIAVNIILFTYSVLLITIYILRSAYVFPWYYPLFSLPLLTFTFVQIINTQYKLLCVTLGIVLIPIVIPNILRYSYTAINTIYPGNYPEYAPISRASIYVGLGKKLGIIYPQAKLLTSEIGGLGYGFDGYILDGAGLASPEALAYHPMDVPEERSHGGLGAIPVEYVKDTHPEIIVSFDEFIEALSKSSIIDQYHNIRCQVFYHSNSHANQSPNEFSHVNIFILKDSLFDIQEYLQTENLVTDALWNNGRICAFLLDSE